MELTNELLATFIGGQVLIQETRDFAFDERRGEDWWNTSVEYYEISTNASRPKKVGEGVEVDFPFKGVYLRFYSAKDSSNIAQEGVGGLAQTRRLLKKD